MEFGIDKRKSMICTNVRKGLKIINNNQIKILVFDSSFKDDLEHLHHYADLAELKLHFTSCGVEKFSYVSENDGYTSFFFTAILIFIKHKGNDTITIPIKLFNNSPITITKNGLWIIRYNRQGLIDEQYRNHIFVIDFSKDL